MEQEAQLTYLMERRLQLLVEMSTKRYDKEIAELKQQLASALVQLETVKSNLKGLREDVLLPPQHRVPEQAPSHQPHEPASVPTRTEGEQQQLLNSASPGASFARSQKCGGYNSSDVSVEKFFYYGNKR